jgi:hypothetical protein
MFLSKLLNGIYHVYYFKENGKNLKSQLIQNTKVRLINSLQTLNRNLNLGNKTNSPPIELKKFHL